VAGHQRSRRLRLRHDHGRQYTALHLQSDPHYRDCIPFYEFFDGDNGRGAGAPHQTGWTGLIAKLLMPRVRE
jgi:hypothetical protein